MPPPASEHIILGELVKADATARTGQFRTDRSGEIVDFSLIPGGGVKFLNADASLADIPPGTRCRVPGRTHDRRGLASAGDMPAGVSPRWRQLVIRLDVRGC